MKHYKQLSQIEREEIALLKSQGQGPTRIARSLKRDKSTISRELRRNATAKGTYTASHAQGKAQMKRARPSKLDQGEELRTYVDQRLMEGWSPQIIAGWLKKNNETLSYINHESIYCHVYGEKGQASQFYKHLFQRKKKRRPHKARRSKDRIPDRVSIHHRPQAIDNRENIGDWEADYMIFKNHQPLLVLHERKSRVVLAVKLFGRSAAETIAALTAKLAKLGKGLAKSVTFDNDTGFSLHRHLTDRLGIKTYFCDAYASWQKGGVENSNGRLRRWLPKRRDLSKVSEKEIDTIVMTMNLTPRRCLDFKTPLQVLLENDSQKLELKFA